MRREPGNELDGEIRRLRGKRPLSEDDARHASEIAALELDYEVRMMILRYHQREELRRRDAEDGDAG